MADNRRIFLGWMVAAGAAALSVAAFEVSNLPAFRPPELRSEHAEEGDGVPPDMTVVVAEDGKTFHVPSCTFIHDRRKARTTTASEAIKEGFTPCTRCLSEYLRQASRR